MRDMEPPTELFFILSCNYCQLSKFHSKEALIAAPSCRRLQWSVTPAHLARCMRMGYRQAAAPFALAIQKLAVQDQAETPFTWLCARILALSGRAARCGAKGDGGG